MDHHPLKALGMSNSEPLLLVLYIFRRIGRAGCRAMEADGASQKGKRKRRNIPARAHYGQWSVQSLCLYSRRVLLQVNFPIDPVALCTCKVSWLQGCFVQLHEDTGRGMELDLHPNGNVKVLHRHSSDTEKQTSGVQSHFQSFASSGSIEPIVLHAAAIFLLVTGLRPCGWFFLFSPSSRSVQSQSKVAKTVLCVALAPTQTAVASSGKLAMEISKKNYSDIFYF